MPRFFIEHTHDEKELECARIVQIFLRTGSHYLTNADWGCRDGVHKAWLILDVASREEAMSVLPPALRSQARIVSLNKFTMEEVDEILSQHESR